MEVVRRLIVWFSLFERPTVIYIWTDPCMYEQLLKLTDKEYRGYWIVSIHL